MALIYVHNQEELEQAFITMGFVEGTGEDAGKWFFGNDTNKIGYFALTYITATANTSPIVYHDSSGQIRNLFGQMNVNNPVLKIEYYRLYNGGICFRWVAGTSASIVSNVFVNNMTVAIFTNGDDNYSTIFNLGSNVTMMDPYFDDMEGVVSNLPTIDFDGTLVYTTDVVIMSKLYNNRNGVIEGEAYSVLTPVPNSTSPYFTTINNIKYIITFGTSNGPNKKIAFRFTDES